MSIYATHPLVEGFPGKSSSHGGFGWSSVWLLDDGERRVLIDAGPPSYIPLIHYGLADLGLTTADVTDVVLTHMHWDHVANFTMFANAAVWVGERELAWAAEQPTGTSFIPDLHVQELLRRDDVSRIAPGQEFLPGIHALDAGGHTPHHLAYFSERVERPMIFAGDAVKNVFELATGRVDSTLDAAQSAATVDRLRSLLVDTAGTLLPGHDVELALVDGDVHRVRAQQARIGYFADGMHGEQDRSIG